MTNKPTIILGLPESYGLSECIQYNLEQNGFTVINISFRDYNFKYENIGQKINNFLRKTFLGDKGYKAILKYNKHKKEIDDKLAAVDKADYALLIRADIYPLFAIQQIKKKSKQLVGYQWDGLQRFPIIRQYIPIFDRFFVFDPVDVSDEDRLQFTTNFFLQSNKPNLSVGEKHRKSVLLFNSYFAERMSLTFELVTRLSSLDIDTNCQIHQPGIPAAHTSNGIHYFPDAVPYGDYLNEVMHADILVDICLSVHKGLSFRFFEAIGYEKKIITNNIHVRQYDFYHPSNIFIIGYDNWDQLESFTQSNYTPLSKEITNKYSFGNWIRYTLGNKPYSQILPPVQL